MNTDQKQQERGNFSDWQIFSKIWLKPRPIFEYIDHTYYTRYLVLLITLIGIANVGGGVFEKSFSSTYDFYTSFLFSIFKGGLLGWIGFYVFAFLLSLTGKWLKGEASTNSMLLMSAHAYIPNILIMLFWIPRIILMDNIHVDIWEERPDPSLSTYFMKAILGIGELVLNIWSLVLLVVGVSVVQQFSLGRAIANVLLPILFLILLGGGAAILFYSFR